MRLSSRVWLWLGFYSLTAFSATFSNGQRLPLLGGEDVLGRHRQLDAYHGRPLLIVVMTHPGAEQEVSSWLVHAATAQPQLQTLAVVTLKLPFFVSTDWVRARMKARIPGERWAHTWFERDGMWKKKLELPESRVPWLFVLDEEGRLKSWVQARFSVSQAETLWRPLSG